MTRPLRLIIFDVDGTLVDSQGDIVAAMAVAFQSANLTVPARDSILSIVGLSLDVAMESLVPDLHQDTRALLVQGYKDAYMSLRTTSGAAVSSPLYPGAAQVLQDLNAVPENILGVATGKSKRGLDKVLAAHGLSQMFATTQVADFHPSKPHPSMIFAAMADAGVGPEQTVMIGDTSFDMDMAHAAGVHAIGVSWGYHDRRSLTAAGQVIDHFDDLDGALAGIWGAR
jgi:phosphoglycolate phosphatase